MNLALAILHKYPNADPLEDFRVRDDGSGQYIADWNLPNPKPTQANLNEWWAEYDTYQKSIAYKELRRNEYPPIGDQLDAIWKMLTPPAGSEAEAMKAQISSVKAKYPKPVNTSV